MNFSFKIYDILAPSLSLEGPSGVNVLPVEYGVELIKTPRSVPVTVAQKHEYNMLKLQTTWKSRSRLKQSFQLIPSQQESFKDVVNFFLLHSGPFKEDYKDTYNEKK